VAKRAMISLGRVGSFCGNGSGDIAIAFTTANRIPHDSDHDILTCRMFYDESIDKVFEASVESVEEAIISSLYHAETTHGIRGIAPRRPSVFLFTAPRSPLRQSPFRANRKGVE